MKFINANTLKNSLVALALSSAIGLSANAGVIMKPTYSADIDYQVSMLTGEYSDSITHPDQIIGFEVGHRVASPAEISKAIEVWKTQSDRMKVVEYAKSHEGRPLYAIYMSTPENLAKLDDINKDITALSDPRKTSDAQANAIIDRLPATAWMAYSIHGNETSGADAALAAIYHLAADQSKATTDLLDDMIIVIDPMMNPDGRARFSKSLEQYRGTAPNVDDQSLLHRGDWPFGRSNHYFFDLNRDFFYLTQPETRGRVALINKFRPQLMIDGHEMGAQDTYLFGPAREPKNFNLSPAVKKWAQTFSVEQGTAFDQKGWRYYTGEWFENLYPGYSNYSEYRGSTHILYEQSRMAEDGVRRPEGTVQTYKESVHHQFVSTIANLESLARYSKDMYKDYWQDRKSVLGSNSRYSNQSFVVLANENHSRTQRLVDVLQAQDIEVYQATSSFKVKKAKNHLGQVIDATVPEGSLVIPNKQPEARLLAAIMEFDAGILPEVIMEERQKVLREGQSVMYDTTAWNLTMMYGLEALTVPQNITKNITEYVKVATAQSDIDTNAIAWSVSGADDKSLAFAARLMEQGVIVRAVDKPTQLGNVSVGRGDIVVTVTDNVKVVNYLDIVNKTKDELGLNVSSITTGYGTGEMPEWGGDHFVLLSKPQLAIVTQSGVSSLDAGSTWYSVDSNLGIRHSHIGLSDIARTDLRRYNVLVMPSAWRVSEAVVNKVKAWVQDGGTLIAHDNSSAALIGKNGLSRIKAVSDIFEEAGDYNLALHRRLLAESPVYKTEQIKTNKLVTDVTYPWTNTPKPLKKDELEKRDEWQKLFMPSGAMVAGNVDQQHWLSFGVNPVLPLLYSDQPVMIAPQNAEVVVSVGVYQDKKGKSEAADEAFAWYTLPENKDLYVRMSGLLWPEAAQRIANSAYLTRERLGNGQVILFSGQPNFRGAALGTNRLLLNAIVLGPGMGTRLNIDL